MSEGNIIQEAENDNDAEAQNNAAKLRKLFRINMYFLLIVPGIFIQFTAMAHMGPIFIPAAFPIPILIGIDLGLLAQYYSQLKKNGKPKLFGEIGTPFMLLMLMVVTIPIGYIGFDNRKDYVKFDFMERIVLSRVQEALQAYVDKNENQYPPADSWYSDIFPEGKKPYGCEEFNVILNPNVMNLGNDTPDGMVIGFICYNGDWGQVAVYDEKVHEVGPILRYITKDEKYSSSYKTIRVADAKYLKWATDEPEISIQKTKEMYSIIGCIVVMLLFVMVKYRKYILNNLVMMISIAFLSMISGGQFGGWAIVLYKGFNGTTVYDTFSIVPILTIVFSCMFVLWMAVYRVRCRYEKCVGWVTLFGTLVGILCSCVLHIVLMFVYDEYTIYPLLAGVPFGAWAGMILGWWVGSWMDNKQNKQLAEVEVSNE